MPLYTLLLLWPSLFPFLSFHDSIRYLSYLSTFLELIISLSFLVFRPLKCFSSMGPLPFHFKIIFSVCFSVFLSNVLFLFANHFFRFKNKFTFILLQRFFFIFPRFLFLSFFTSFSLFPWISGKLLFKKYDPVWPKQTSNCGIEPKICMCSHKVNVIVLLKNWLETWNGGPRWWLNL